MLGCKGLTLSIVVFRLFQSRLTIIAMINLRHYVDKFIANTCFLGISGFPLQAPLVYHYGHVSPAPSEKLYNKISSKIAEVTKERFEKNKKGRCASYMYSTVYM